MSIGRVFQCRFVASNFDAFGIGDIWRDIQIPKKNEDAYLSILNRDIDFFDEAIEAV